MMNKQNCYTTEDVYAETYFQLPKVFFTNKKYISLSNDAKVAFAILKDRFNYSVRNNWIDEDKTIYFIFTVEELCSILNCGTQKVTKIKKELENVNLLYQRRMGVNKANRLYLLKPEVLASDVYKQTNESKNVANRGLLKIKIPNNPKKNLDNSGLLKIKIRENDSQTLDNSGLLKIKNNLYKEQELDTLKEDTKETDTRKQQQENYLLNHFAESHEEYSFLNRQNLELIGLFSDTLADAENMQGIILRAKKEIEKKHEAVLVLDEEYIHNEALAIQEDIEKTLRRIYQKRKTDSTIKNIDNYTYGAFKNLFEQKLGELTMLSSENVATISTHDWLN